MSKLFWIRVFAVLHESMRGLESFSFFHSIFSEGQFKIKGFLNRKVFVRRLKNCLISGRRSLTRPEGPAAPDRLQTELLPTISQVPSNWWHKTGRTLCSSDWSYDAAFSSCDLWACFCPGRSSHSTGTAGWGHRQTLTDEPRLPTSGRRCAGPRSSPRSSFWVTGNPRGGRDVLARATLSPFTWLCARHTMVYF